MMLGQINAKVDLARDERVGAGDIGAMGNHRKPGDPAPQRGYYLEHNVFGSPSIPRRVVWCEKAVLLPECPRGFTWLLTQTADQKDER